MSTVPLATPGRRLRDAWSTETIAMPGRVQSPWSAKMAERLGFRAVYLSGAALSAAWACPTSAW